MAEQEPAPTVEVREVRDPLGRPSVLFQVNEWWLTMSPDEARHLAVLLIASAEAIDQKRGLPGFVHD